MYNLLIPNLRRILGNAKMLMIPLMTPQIPKMMPMVKLLKPRPPTETEEEYMRG